MENFYDGHWELTDVIVIEQLRQQLQRELSTCILLHRFIPPLGQVRHQVYICCVVLPGIRVFLHAIAVHLFSQLFELLEFVLDGGPLVQGHFAKDIVFVLDEFYLVDQALRVHF